VLCESSAVADALSTALFSMDLEEGIKLIESFENVHAMWINEKGEKFYSENFEKFCKQQ